MPTQVASRPCSAQTAGSLATLARRRSARLRAPFAAQAALYISMFNGSYPGMYSHVQGVRAFAKSHGFVKSMWGRTRSFAANGFQWNDRIAREAGNMKYQVRVCMGIGLCGYAAPLVGLPPGAATLVLRVPVVDDASRKDLGTCLHPALHTPLAL